jgi:hypothetical protein
MSQKCHKRKSHDLLHLLIGTTCKVGDSGIFGEPLSGDQTPR